MPQTDIHLRDTVVPDPATAGTPEALPAVVAPTVPARLPGPRRRRLLFLIPLLIAAGGAAYWWTHRPPTLPPGFAVGNGRLEADAIDIDTKLAGRIAELRADEGDLVKAGQLLAVMDTRDLQAQMKQSQELVEEASRAVEQAKANHTQQEAVVKFAEQELARTKALVPNGYETVEKLDQQTQLLNSANATLRANEAAVAVAERALEAAKHQVEFYGVQIADSLLTAPKTGPIEYRVANVGEVLPAGGKVFTMLDASYVYMDVYLPTVDAGRVRLNGDARIVLDAYQSHVIPAHVVYVASEAQFTPKTVETKDERDKLMFRIRVRIDPDRLAGIEALVKTGLPGVAYVRTASDAVWPANLAPSPPPTPKS